MKYYCQDENVFNVIVSYYIKGLLVVFVLDLMICMQIYGECLFDDVMCVLWVIYGCDFYVVGYMQCGVIEVGLISLMEEIMGVCLCMLVCQLSEGCDDLLLFVFFKVMGVSVMCKVVDMVFVLGVKIVVENGFVKLQQVFDDSLVQCSGLFVGDLIVVVDGLCVLVGQFDKMFMCYCVGDIVLVYVFCCDELMMLNVKFVVDVML